MLELPWIALLTLTALVAGVLLVAAAWRRGKAGRLEEQNSRAIFALSSIFLPVGLAWMAVAVLVDAQLLPTSFPLLGLGVISFSIGLANRNKWSKDE
jgi:hypothetical protein